MDDDLLALILSRVNSIYAARRNQLLLNSLAADGGREYVDRRLWRGANESNLSWEGENREGVVIPGRKERTFNLNDAGRVAGKIEQYIFSEQADRSGADAGFLENVTGARVGIDAFMLDVCHQITVGQWCWVQVGARRDGGGSGGTLYDKARENFRVRWKLWPSLSVPDWHLREDGTIDWIITESVVEMASDPRVKATQVTVRTLYEISPEDGIVHVSEFVRNAGQVKLDFEPLNDVPVPGLTRIPFVLVGTPAARPWWFDQVEQAQCSTMNLTSLNHETFYTSIFPQMVVSESMVQNLETSIREEKTVWGKAVRIVRELIRGRRNPIIESVEEKGLTRFIEPTANSTKQMTEETERIRKAIFDNVGLALFNRETRQVQSADSKKFDHLDTNSTLRHRALMLQRAEADLVELSKMFDPAFVVWSPAYPMDFNVFDAEKVSQALAIVANLPDITPEIKKMYLISSIHLLADMTNFPPEVIDRAVEEVKKLDFKIRTIEDIPPFGDDDDDDDGGDEPEGDSPEGK